jgi:hypothetical protein
MCGNGNEVGRCTAPLCPLFPYRQHAIDKRFLFPDKKPDPEILKTDMGVCAETFKIAV